LAKTGEAQIGRANMKANNNSCGPRIRSVGTSRKPGNNVYQAGV